MSQSTSAVDPAAKPAGKRPPRIDVDGVLLLDKPLGLSSNDALVCAKRLLNAKKAGHTGTLDPLATGLLPLCFGEATKFSQGLLDSDKTYEAQVLLGVKTASGDSEGEVLQTRPVQCTVEQVRAALTSFTGEIDQVPPMYSALKKDGKPLYAYARAGETVEREARRVRIHEIDLLVLELPTLRIRVRCSKGTYIRTLAEDIGEHLGCGAHLTALRRTAVGTLRLEDALTLERLDAAETAGRAALLEPVDALVADLPRIDLDAVLEGRFCQGQRLAQPPGVDALRDAQIIDLVRVYGPGGALLGVAQLRDGVLRPQRLVR
ncbi:MAG: tRNA pseudouridine(55) synthase TruB [Candidatus Protistobacter heckmanni]|nr:tRNA pseudouridine(55) synthase TruB [Candidatus Protistobacter heckmanni]